MYIAFVMFFFGTITLYSQSNSLYIGKACLINPSDPPPTAGTSSCSEPTYFFDVTDNNFGNFDWDFGDGTIRNSINRNPTHAYASPGTYTVTVTARNGTTTVLNQDSKQVHVGYYPKQPLFDKKTQADTTICGGSTITLDPFDGLFNSAPSGVSYKWYPDGQTSSTIPVNEAGCYTVEVIDDISGCSRFATITVKVCYEDQASSGGAERWYFGEGSGLEFTMTGTEVVQDSLDNEGSLDPQPEITNPTFDPSVPRANDNFETDEAAAVVLDKGNAVVLYTDGKKIFSGEGDTEIPVVGTSTPYSINKDVGTQGVALIPKPMCNACDFIFYYVLTVDQATGILSYSEIDMRENNRMGAVTKRDIPLAVNMTGKITVERAEDDESFVVYAFDKNSNTFLNFTIDSVGITASNPTLLTAPVTEQSRGYVSISSDQSTLAHAMMINGENVVVLMSVDRTSNQLTEIAKVNLGSDSASIYGLAFSPNGDLLYVTLQGNGGSIPSKLLQLDISSGDASQIAASAKTVATGNHKFGALALGPKYGDGEKYIYITVENTNRIHYLQAPNEIITTDPAIVGFTYIQTGGGIEVPGLPKLGFPNVAAPQQDSDGGGSGPTYTGNCLNVTTTLNIQAICDPYENEVEWTVEGQKYTGQQVSHVFSREGWHDIDILIKVRKPSIINVSGIKVPGERCTEVPQKGRIYIKPAPKLDIPDPFYVCTDAGFYTIYKPEPTGGETFTYLWMTSLGQEADPPNGRRDFFEFKIAGAYKLDITNELECTTSYDFNTIKGCEPVIYMPNVITPNNDGPLENENLKIISRFIERPTLEIYNRWGDQIFQTDDLENDRWDGTYKGRPVPTHQLYAYIIRYFSRDFPDRGEQKKIGSVLVLKE